MQKDRKNSISTYVSCGEVVKLSHKKDTSRIKDIRKPDEKSNYIPE